MHLFLGIVFCFFNSSAGSPVGNKALMEETKGCVVAHVNCEDGQNTVSIKNSRNGGISIILLDEW